MSPKLSTGKILDVKFALRHYLNTADSIISDFKQALGIGVEKYKRLEKQIPIETMFFEVSNICNAKCVFCAYRKSKGPKGIMPFSTFRKALDEFIALGGKEISFTPTIGEPLVDKGLAKKIKYASGKKELENTYLYTNGILLAKNQAYKKIIDSGITEICISMPEPVKENYKRIYGIDACKKVIEGVSKLLEYNKVTGEKARILLAFRTSIHPSKVIESQAFRKNFAPFLSKKVSYSFLADFDNWGGTISKKDLYGIMRMRRAFKAKKILCAKTFDVSVLFDGSIRMCACRVKENEFDELVIGNIKNETLENIFYGGKAEGIRKGFCEGNLPTACRECSLYTPATKKWIERKISMNKEWMKK